MEELNGGVGVDADKGEKWGHGGGTCLVKVEVEVIKGSGGKDGYMEEEWILHLVSSAE